ncbi:MAG TPA: cyclic nucleotide-binding domain-containing protein, partial [Aggregatilineales bacterium]|nr:cyclic nucleotide-binding domain-containing protein [Aggregatilineales bacterium]
MTVSLDELKTINTLLTLSDEELTALAQLMICREYAPGEMIFLEGDESSGIWFIYRGKVRIIKFSASGRTQALCIANSGKCVGTCPLFNQ